MKDKNFCNNELMKCVDLNVKESMCNYYNALLIYYDDKDKYKRCNSCVKEAGDITI